MIRIYSKDALKVNLEEEKSCSKLVTSGSIYTLYVECCDIRHKVKNRVFIVKDNGICIGWAVIKERKSSRSTNFKFEFMVYIKRKYRRQGIGTKFSTVSWLRRQPTGLRQVELPNSVTKKTG